MRQQPNGAKKKQNKKLAAMSIDGIWVGQVARAGEHIVIKPSGDAVRCRTIKRVPEEHRWVAERAPLVEATPRIPSPSSKKDPEDIGTRVAGEDEGEDVRPIISPEFNEVEDPVELAEARKREFARRNFRISERILDKHGETEGCKGCFARRLGWGRAAHSSECRERLRNQTAEDELDQMIVESAARRKAE